MMDTAKRIGARMSLSIGVAVLVMATVTPASSASAPAAPPPDKTALVLCGTTCPTPDAFVVDAVKNQFIAPTHPGQDMNYVAVTTPEEFWPISGVFRLLGLALGPPSLFGLDGAAWPDEPWWKLSGLFDLTGDQSLKIGATNLEAAMAAHGNDDLVIFGVSQGAGVVNVVKRKLAEQYPAGTKAPDIDFVLAGDPNLPNGGLASRFAGLYIPILDLSFNGPAATDTQFDTVEINREYDGFADLPMYPLNVISLANALLGVVYSHMYILDVSLPADPTKSPAYQGKHGDTSYYLFENPDLPLFGPLRTLGVPEPLIDVVEPFFKVIVDLGYDRTIKPWEPTPAQLIPPLNPVKVAGDLVDAIGEGINNAAALIGLSPKPSVPAPVALAAPATEPATADMSPEVKLNSTLTQTQQVTVDANDERNPAGDVDRHGDRTHQVTSIDTPTQIQQVSSAPADASELSTTATPEPSTSTATPKPTKHGPSTSSTGTTAAEPATTAGSLSASSAPASSTPGSNSSAGDSSGDDAVGSD
jgi:hypothetical protein